MKRRICEKRKEEKTSRKCEKFRKWTIMKDVTSSTKSKEEFMKKEEEKKYPESIQNLEENKKKLENEEVEFEPYLRKLKGWIAGKKVKTQQNIKIHSDVKTHQNVQKYFDKEDVEKLKLPVKKQIRRMLLSTNRFR